MKKQATLIQKIEESIATQRVTIEAYSREERLKKKEENETRQILRPKILRFLQDFNAEYYSAIKPFLERTPFEFFSIYSGNVRTANGDCAGSRYDIALGEKPKIVLGGVGWGGHLLNSNYSTRVLKIGTGLIHIKRAPEFFEDIIVDIARDAIGKADGNSRDALNAYINAVKEHADYTTERMTAYLAHNKQLRFKK